MRFPPDFIEKVRDANNIVEIIGQYTELKSSGPRLMGRCPFPDHGDKSPSFSVNEDNQLYHCFGCKKGGNIYTFLQAYNGMAFPEAVEHLARRASIPLPEPEPNAPQRRMSVSHDEKDQLLRVNKVAAVFYHHQLKGLADDHPAQQYLVKRGLTPEIVEKFRLGYSTDEWQGLVKRFRETQVPTALAEKLHIITPKKNASAARPDDAYYDRFRERLMFPIFNTTSEVIGFGGRTLGDGLPKYLNSSDSPIFNKSRVLYGIHETGKFIRAEDSAIVVEGYMDALALYSAGIKNVVAILGTAFTPEHAKLLKRNSLNVTMLLDGDEAGITAAERSLPILLEAGILPKGLILPEGQDPDDYVKAHGAEKLKSAIDRAPDLFTVLLSKRWMASYHGRPTEKSVIINEAAAILRLMTNNALRDLYILEMARQLDSDVTWLRRELQKVATEIGTKLGVKEEALTSGRPEGRGDAKGPVPVVRAPLSPSPKVAPKVETELAADAAEDAGDPLISLKGAPRDEAFVLSLLLQSEELMRDFVDAGSDSLQLFVHEGIRKALKLALDSLEKRPQHFASLASDIVSRVDSPEVISSALSLIPDLGTRESADKARRILGDYMRSIRQKFYKRQARVIASQLAQGSPENLEQKLEELREIHRIMSEDDKSE